MKCHGIRPSVVAYASVHCLLLCSGLGRAGAAVIARQEITPTYVALYLNPSGWRFRLEYVGFLQPADHFRYSGPVVLNCLYFHTRTGATAGTLRSASRTITDDGRRFGTGLAWDDSGWRLVDPWAVATSPNGFQAGPTLLRGGRILADCRAERVNPDPSRSARRAAVARTRSGQTLLVVTLKGFALSRFARLLCDLGAWDAVNLDGGSSAFIFVEGRELVKASRWVPAALVVEEMISARPPAQAQVAASQPSRLPWLGTDRARPSATTATSGLVTVLFGLGDYQPQIVFLPRGQTPEEALDRLRPKPAVLVSPCLFDPARDRPLGTLICNRQSIQGHVGPAVGYSWTISSKGFALSRCTGHSPANCDIGGCGPAYVLNGSPDIGLASQGYTRYGGLFDPAPRVAIGVTNMGKLFVAGTDEPLTPKQFAEALIKHANARHAVGLSGGPHSVLYAYGRWYLRPSARVPYVISFSESRE